MSLSRALDFVSFVVIMYFSLSAPFSLSILEWEQKRERQTAAVADAEIIKLLFHERNEEYRKEKLCFEIEMVK